MKELELELRNLIQFYMVLDSYIKSVSDLLQSGQSPPFETYSQYIADGAARIEKSRSEVRRLLKERETREYGAAITDLLEEAGRLANHLLGTSQTNQILIKQYLTFLSHELGEIHKGQQYIRCLEEMMPRIPKYVDSSI